MDSSRFTLHASLIKAREASISLAQISPEAINKALLTVADAAEAHADDILTANARDLARMVPSNPMYDRLLLTPQRIHGIANDTRQVASLPSPLGKILKESTLPNGLQLQRVAVSFGVIGIIYEARPNVTFDVFALCLKAGSACVLKGGKDAEDSNIASVALIKQALRKCQLPEDIITLLPATHEATTEMLHAQGEVDLVIPRGSRRLIDYVRREATIPIIETGAGVCHAYFDAAGNIEKGRAIIYNAKTRRVSVCNALDCMLIHSQRLSDLPTLCAPLAVGNKPVRIYADSRALSVLAAAGYPAQLLHEATDVSYGTEFQDYAMAIKVVDSLDEALGHIRQFGSGHSECIITEDASTARRFLTLVDAACVYHNAPTSFTDGAQFGLGAEIGISTQKLHARGPMALEEICTYKWLIRGNGQTRPA